MGFTYLVTGVNIYPIPEVIQGFVQIPGSCSSQETGCSIGLGGKKKKYETESPCSPPSPAQGQFFAQLQRT